MLAWGPSSTSPGSGSDLVAATRSVGLECRFRSEPTFCGSFISFGVRALCQTSLGEPTGSRSRQRLCQSWTATITESATRISFALQSPW